MKKKFKSITYLSIRAILIAVVFVMLLGAFFCYMSYRNSVERSKNTVKIGVNDVLTSLDDGLHMSYGGLAYGHACRFEDVSLTDPDAVAKVFEEIEEEVIKGWSLNYEFHLIDIYGIIRGSLDEACIGKDLSEEPQTMDYLSRKETWTKIGEDEITGLVSEDQVKIEELRPSIQTPDQQVLYVDYPIASDKGFLRVGIPEKEYKEQLRGMLFGTVRYRSLGRTGHMFTVDSDGIILDCFKGTHMDEPMKNVWPDFDASNTNDIDWDKTSIDGEDVCVTVSIVEDCQIIGYMPQSEVSRAAWSSVLSLLVNLLIMATLLIFLLVVFFRKRMIESEKARINEELAFAKKIQLSAMPKHLPEKDSFLVHAGMRTAKEVGGDFYDVFMVGDDTLVILIADVSGKGIPAALFMMEAKAVIEEQVAKGLTPGEVFTNTNNTLCAKNEAGMFVTAWIGFLDIKSGKLTMANAGHNPFVFIHEEKVILEKRNHGLILGTFEGVTYKEDELQLVPGDILYLYTDGVTEACGENGLYGEERMLEVLTHALTDETDALRGSDKPDSPEVPESVQSSPTLPSILCDTMNRDVDDFTSGDEQTDDITMICVQYLGRD